MPLAIRVYVSVGLSSSDPFALVAACYVVGRQIQGSVCITICVV